MVGMIMKISKTSARGEAPCFTAEFLLVIIDWRDGKKEMCQGNYNRWCISMPLPPKAGIIKSLENGRLSMEENSRHLDASNILS